VADTPLSPEQLASWKIPRDPQMTPDGERIVFVLAESSKPDEHKRSTLWMIDTTQDRVWQFTNGPRADSEPQWSPDGSRLAFVSDRKEPEKQSLYTIPRGGGEATTLVEWKSEVSSPRWSPDGRQIAFIAKDPETDDEAKRKKDRHDEIVVETNYKFGRLYVVPSAGGEPRRITPEEQAHVTAFDWLPDGTGFVVASVATPLVDNIGYGPTDLRCLPFDDGTEPRALAHLGAIDEPRISPDGRTVAYRSKSGRVTEADAIWLLPMDGGDPHCLTKGYEGLIESFAWAPGSRQLRFSGYENLHGALRIVDVETGAIAPLLAPDQKPHGSFDSAISFDASGWRFAIVRSATDEPENIWLGEVGGDLTRATDLNADLAGSTFSRGEAISWQSTDGLTIHGLLFRPVGFQEGKKYPLVVHIHGGPAWLWSDRFLCNWHDWAQPLAQRGYAVFLPNPRGSTGRGADFTDREANDYGGMELHDVLTGVDHVVSLGFVDPQRMGVGGWSHGGYMTNWTITQTDRFKCAISGAGPSNFLSDQGQNDIPRFNTDYYDRSVYEDLDRYLQRTPVAHVAHVRTPTLILHGEKDERVALPQGQEMYRALQWAGVETQLVIYPREPHSIGERAHQIDLAERVFAWFERFLKPGVE